MNCEHIGDGWCLFCVEKLQQTIENQQQTIHNLYAQLEQMQKQARRRWEDDSDYVPYHEYEER